MSRLLLFPVSLIYGLVVKLRNILFDLGLLKVYQSALPVVCVGNVEVGGSGKTPFCYFICERAVEMGFSPVVLTRGYKGRIKGPHLVEQTDTARDIGDEALLYRRWNESLPVVIARSRVEGAKFIEERRLGDLIVLDDGFQHRYLARDINLLLVDGKNRGLKEEKIDGKLLPLGRLRESVSDAAARADIAVVVSRGDAEERLTKLEGMEVLHFNLKPGGFRDLVTGADISSEELSSRRPTAVTAIAKPAGFFDLLKKEGVKVSSEVAFADHHLYKESELKSYLSSKDGSIITTEKDGVKLVDLKYEPGKVFEMYLKGELVSGETLWERIEDLKSN